jgi:serine-aspartate repeat-containing protein C/D/E
MESRQLLSITVPQIDLGAVYIETGKGDDLTGDVFAISFAGGADGTQLTELTIDLNSSNSSVEYCFFDKTSTFSLVSDSDDVGLDTDNIVISTDRTTLTLYFNDFTAGEKLVFTIDVDENTDSVITPLAEADEITWNNNATITAAFAADHYETASLTATFSNVYTTSLGLPDDNYSTNQIEGVTDDTEVDLVDTAGAFASITQNPLPVTISGYVYEVSDPEDLTSIVSALDGFTVSLYYSSDGGDTYGADPIAATVTDSNGHYSFTTDGEGNNLLPGTYKVVETQLDEYLDVGALAGTVEGAPRGKVYDENTLYNITLLGGEDSVNNDFYEITPASISGHVYYDANNNGLFDAKESLITKSTTIKLFDADDNVLDTYTTTDGYYKFSGLMPGEYTVKETTPPAGYLDGTDSAGSAGGTAGNDVISDIPLSAGTAATDYDFGEIKPASLSGKVFVDLDNDGAYDSGETLLSDVTVFLYDNEGTLIATTTTDDNGAYSFTGLMPDTYSVEEVQPDGYYEGGDIIGYINGVADTAASLDGVDKIINVTLVSGDEGTAYDFYEIAPASISGYVFQDGPIIQVKDASVTPDVPSLRDGKLTSDDTRLAGITLQLCDGSGYPLSDSSGNPITTVTNADGYYEFTGLQPGDYSVQLVTSTLPDGYLTGIDTAGSEGGYVVNKYSGMIASQLSSLGIYGLTTSDEAIVKIALNSGDNAEQYNFSVVKIKDSPIGPPSYPDPPQQFVKPYFASTPSPLQYGVPYALPPIIMMPAMSGGSGSPPGYTWHLSVINGGQPRDLQKEGDFLANHQPGIFDPETWSGAEVNQGDWIIADANGVPIKKYHFGLSGAIPVTGDWNGDGVTDIGVFLNGLWFIDLNGNGEWDENDLWVKLGQKDDRPVTGDWDGDGKTDIGIFGPAWIGDTHAVAVEPGLPDALNPPKNRYKNVPPEPEDAAIGWRSMKRTSAGKIRSDLIDHVFQFGAQGDQPVIGDWNGDGIYAIGIFRNGTWFIDIDGDGRWSAADMVVEFGQEGDIPLVGDWTGDGVSKLGVWRNGTFYLDTNNNHVLDATDKVFALGNPGDKPFVGDFTGSGVDTVGVYQAGAAGVSAPAPTPAGD